MAWSNSKIFSACLTDALNKTRGINLGGDTIEAALFDNTVTPSQTVASASTAYGAGVWASGGVVDTGSSAPAGWPALGRPLGSLSSAFSSNVYTFTAANTASANSVTTLTNAYGCLVYDHTTTSPAGTTDAGICFNYFGGANSVTLGSFTIAWNASGIFTLTL